MTTISVDDLVDHRSMSTAMTIMVTIGLVTLAVCASCCSAFPVRKIDVEFKVAADGGVDSSTPDAGSP